MKQKKLIKYLKENSCYLVRDGSKHFIYKNTKTGELSTVFRHSDLKESLCRKICKDLGIPDILMK
jgi:predicted RNA binding protein YcfA (HicA-like mRNA interferase family)